MKEADEYIQTLKGITARTVNAQNANTIINNNSSSLDILSEDWRVNTAAFAVGTSLIGLTGYGLYSLRAKSEEEILLNRIKKNDPTLRELKWPSKLNNTMLKQVCKALTNNSYVMSLDLSSSGNDLDIEPLCSLFEDNTTLVELNLTGLYMNDKNAKKLGNLLQKNQTLQRLILQVTGIKNAGVKAICLGLEQNHSLQEFNFSFNSINDIGIDYICNMLKTNKTLASFGFNQHYYDGFTILGLEKAMKDNHSVCLDFDYVLAVNDQPVRAQTILNYTNRNEAYVKGLHNAIKNNELDKTKMYIDKLGVSLISTSGEERNTPLHLAVRNRNIEITSFLLSAMQEGNIPLHLKNDNGQTAFDLAEGYQELLNLFPQANETTTDRKYYCNIM